MQVAFVPQLQSLVAADIGLTDGLVQVADIGQDGVDLFHIGFKLFHLALICLTQLFGSVAYQIRQGFRRFPHQGIVLLGAGFFAQVLQLCKQVVELPLDHAELALAVADLVQGSGQLIQAFELKLVLALIGLFRAVADVDKGVAQLGHALGQHAVADIHAVLGDIPVHRAAVDRTQVHPLARVAVGIDVGDIVAGHVQGSLGGVDAQPGGGIGAEGTDNSHSKKSSLSPKGPQARKSVFLRGTSPSSCWGADFSYYSAETTRAHRGQRVGC